MNQAYKPLHGLTPAFLPRNRIDCSSAPTSFAGGSQEQPPRKIYQLMTDCTSCSSLQKEWGINSMDYTSLCTVANALERINQHELAGAIKLRALMAFAALT